MTRDQIVARMQSDAITLLRVMLADNQIAHPYSRAAVEIIKTFDQASGLPPTGVHFREGERTIISRTKAHNF